MCGQTMSEGQCRTLLFFRRSAIWATARTTKAKTSLKAGLATKNAPKCTSSPFQDVSASNKDCGAISWAKVNKITTGMSGGKEFGTNGTVNRGSMASFLKRLYEHMH